MERRSETVQVSDGKTLVVHTVTGSGNDNKSASSNIPVVRIDGLAGDGPCLLFTGGIHGDEYEGPAVIARLARDVDPNEIRGTMILAPQVNPSALRARRRRSPHDDRDLNRSFPGTSEGSISEVIADFVTRQLLPEADAVFDLHAAGDWFMIPSTLCHFLEDSDLQAQTVAAMKAFAAPAGILLDEDQADTMFDAQVEKSGKVFFTAELGSTACLTVETLEIAWRGVNNLLTHYGMWDRPAVNYTMWNDWDEARLLSASDHRAQPKSPSDGFFVPHVEIGQPVDAQNIVGSVYNLDDPTVDPIPVPASLSGRVYGRMAGGYVSENEDIAVIGEEVPWDQYC